MYNKEDPDCPVFIPNALRSGQENAFPTEDKPVNKRWKGHAEKTAERHHFLQGSSIENPVQRISQSTLRKTQYKKKINAGKEFQIR